MNSSKGLLFLALACMLSTACVMEVDETGEGEVLGTVEQDFGGLPNPGTKSDRPQQYTAEEGTVTSDAEGDVFEPLLDPDPVSWKSPPIPGADDSRGAETPDSKND